MSQTKKYKFQLIFVLLVLCFFMFGCKNETPVDDIYFNLDSGEQIVLIVGQTLDLDEYVVVKPSYATNKKYTITSFDETIVRVENNKLVALKEDQTFIKVTSNDNPLKESVMTVIVKATQEKLSAPLNFEYDSDTQVFRFDPVLYASTYTVKINGKEINIGNSTVFDLKDYDGASSNSLLIAQVKANAPAYSYALKTSDYTSECKVYQAGAISNLKVVGGIASFDRSSSVNKHNVYINNTLIAENISNNYISLKNLNEIYAGQTINVAVESVIPNEVKQQYGSDVICFNSSKRSVVVNVLDVTEINLSATSVGWSNVSHASGYSVLIDGVKKLETKNNHFDLLSLNDFENIFVDNSLHVIKVLPILSNESVNVAQTTKESLVKVKRLDAVGVECDGTNLIWNTIENSSVYSIHLSGDNIALQTSTDLNAFSMKSYQAGSYSLTITAVAQLEPDAGGIYYLSSKSAVKNFVRHETLTADIENYTLQIGNLGTGEAQIDFDQDDFDTTIFGKGETSKYDLKDFVFEAGTHVIKLKRLGDKDSIDSEEIQVEFVQLEKINLISILNGIVSVERSATNQKAIIKLETTGENLSQPIVVEGTDYVYNTEKSSEENYLPAGEYVTRVYVSGDGSLTFSYRENGEVVSNSFVEFEVLSVPNNFEVDKETAVLTFAETSNKYKLYIPSVEAKELQTNSYAFDLNAGSVSCQVQSIGDGIKTLNSAISNEVTITRLETPSLKFDNINNVLSKVDVQYAESYVLTHNGEVVPNYNFGIDEIDLKDEETGNVFTLRAVAIDGSDINFYLNSLSFELTLHEINNSATISLNGLDNTIIVQPTSHSKEFDLVVEFGLTDGVQTFATKMDETNGKVLSNGKSGKDEIVLQYSYVGKAYYIEIIDENYNAIIPSMNEEFSVRVKYIQPSTGNDDLINSDYSENATLNLNRIDESSTIISVNEDNQIVVANDHTQEFALVGVLMTSATFGYIVESNGEGQLVCNKYILNGEVGNISQPVELNYTYSYNRSQKKSYYYIDILNENKESIVPDLNSSFLVKVKYSFLHNGVESDLDSDYSLEKTISVQPVASIARDGQNLKITNVRETYTYLNYSLLINNTYSLLLDNSAESLNGFIIFDVEYIYSKTPINYLQDVNLVEVVVVNVETNEEEPVLSKKGGGILISKTPAVTLSNYKYNDNEDGKNNNSTVVEFNTYSSTYSKEYIVEISTAQASICSMKYMDSDAVNSVISFSMDDIAELVDVSGMVNVAVRVQTVGEVQEEKTIYMFNSISSNILKLNKIAATKNLNVSDSTLTFDAVNNAVGYEIWEITGTGKIKLSTNLITKNFYEITNITGQKQIAIKAISKTGNFTNSSLSEMITIHKVEKPIVSAVDGKFNLKLTSNLLSLLTNQNIQIIPEISNELTGNVEINLGYLDGSEIVLSGSNLIVEPYLFLSYRTQSLQSEKISVKYKIKQTADIDGVYYLNSEATEMSCYGLFEPTSVKKTTAENNTVEMISWVPSDKNLIEGNPISVGYVFKIEYSNGESFVPYYSSDVNLKYYDNATQSYVSYPTYISSTSAIFPAGYGLNDDGSLAVEFGAGNYKISVKAVPLSVIDNYNVFNSKYTSTCDFEIMKESTLSVEQGKLVWDANIKADHYIVSIYEQNMNSPYFVDTIKNAEYDFTNANLNALDGVYKVIVKSISVRDDTLNSANSEALYIYRLPQAGEILVDDGHLILSATKFFDYAEIELVDTTTNVKHKLPTLDNSQKAKETLMSLNIENWSTFADNALISEMIKYPISIDNEALKVLEGGNYTINVKLIGNNNLITKIDEETKEETVLDLGFISSVKTITLSNMTATKLKANTVDVKLGVVQFMPDSEYATISKEGTYKSIVDLNYSFNGETSSDFWSETTLYKIVVTTSLGPTAIYAVDYYSLITAIANETIAESEYELINGSYGLYAWVKYPYADGTLYFNVFEENKINLRDYDKIIHYSIQENMENGINMFSCGTESVGVDLVGTITIDIFMMGGDSYNSGDKIIAHLTAKAPALNQFERYGRNEISTLDGEVKFNDLTPIVEDVTIDNPVYKIVVTKLNSSNKQTYYIYSTTREEAETIAKRHDAENYSSAIYLQINNEEQTVKSDNGSIIFDLSQYISQGTYKATIQTLAGMGNGEVNADDYYINAKTPDEDYTLSKLTDTQFTASNGVLQFAQSYIVNDGVNIPYDNYEVTIIDEGTEFVFDLGRDSDGVSINESTNIVSYVLPATLNDGKLKIEGGKQYSIKVRGKATDNLTLNGTYKQVQEQDVLFVFEKSLGLSETSSDKLRIENGILKWKVLDLENYSNTIINVSFLDANLKTKTIQITVGKLSKYEVEGIYKYHYYEFTNEEYSLIQGGKAQMVDKITYTLEDGQKEERVVNYTISAYTMGGIAGTKNIINSNVSTIENLNRLSMVDTTSIKSLNGVLVWKAVENANGYDVILNGNKNYTFTTYSTSINFLNEDYLIDVGNYDIQIKAIGSSSVSSMVTDKDDATGFIQLDKVTKVEIDGNKIVWTAVNNADAYKIVFNYIDISGEAKTITETIEETSFTTPSGISGMFIITISAVSVGEGKEFNSQSIDFKSSSEAPMQVEKFEFDDKTNRFIIDVKKANFLDSDSLSIVYNFAEYVDNETTSATILENKTISYLQAGMFEEIDNETVRYYYPLTVMGQYSNIAVQVVRPGTVPSNSVQVKDIDLKLFSYGGGTEANPYRIYEASHLLNISYFPSAHYVLTASIRMDSVNVEERLNQLGAIIAEEFSGVLNGDGFSIYGFNVDQSSKTDTITLNDVTTFAMFKNLKERTVNGVKKPAEIKNLTIGSENIQLILVNTFAKDVENVINLSLIATGANNSIIDNVDILDFKVQLESNVNISRTVYVAGLINNATNSTITNSTIKFTAEVNIGFAENLTENLYVGGAISKANISNVTNTDIEFILSTGNDNIVSYVGGAIAYFEGDSSRSTGISETSANILVTNVKVSYFGGLVGFANYINISNSSSEGTYTKANINYNVSIGGLVGIAQSSIIQDSGSTINFNVSVSSTTDKYFGAIAGKLTVINSISGSVSNCYMGSTYQEMTIVTKSLITLGMYGYKDLSVTYER